MPKEKQFTQSRLFEFKPDRDITVDQILELVELVRIGVSGDTISEATDGLKKHFQEVEGE